MGLLIISIARTNDIYNIIFYSCIVGFFFCWPLWIFWFLLKNHENLADKKFNERFRTLYNGIKLSSTAALAYKAIFAVRRFDIILDNLVFTTDSPMLGLQTNHYLEKVLIFLLLQTCYLIYVHKV